MGVSGALPDGVARALEEAEAVAAALTLILLVRLALAGEALLLLLPP